jgi:hypothetical protein
MSPARFAGRRRCSGALRLGGGAGDCQSGNNKRSRDEIPEAHSGVPRYGNTKVTLPGGVRGALERVGPQAMWPYDGLASGPWGAQEKRLSGYRHSNGRTKRNLVTAGEIAGAGAAPVPRPRWTGRDGRRGGAPTAPPPQLSQGRIPLGYFPQGLNPGKICYRILSFLPRCLMEKKVLWSACEVL